MTTMIERVARALEAKISSKDFISFEDAARAAIEEMREPTREMVLVGYDEINLNIDYYNYDSGSGYTVEDIAPTATWQSMIDAALKE